jgi:hypothetical protein
MGFEIVTGFIEHLENATRSTCSLIANSHPPQFTTAYMKSSQSAVSSPVDVPLLPGSRPRRLATISHQPPTLLTKSKSKLCCDLQSRGQCDLVPSTHVGPKIRFLLNSFGCVNVGRPL